MARVHLCSFALAPTRCYFLLQVQIIRIQLRVPEYGWTTQKVFHLLNFLVCGLRSGVFALRYQVQELPYPLVQAGLLDLPGACVLLGWAGCPHIGSRFCKGRAVRRSREAPPPL